MKMLFEGSYSKMPQIHWNIREKKLLVLHCEALCLFCFCLFVSTFRMCLVFMPVFGNREVVSCTTSHTCPVNAGGREKDVAWPTVKWLHVQISCTTTSPANMRVDACDCAVLPAKTHCSDDKVVYVCVSVYGYVKLLKVGAYNKTVIQLICIYDKLLTIVLLLIKHTKKFHSAYQFFLSKWSNVSNSPKLMNNSNSRLFTERCIDYFPKKQCRRWTSGCH